jgi:hypothetical protein
MDRRLMSVIAVLFGFLGSANAGGKDDPKAMVTRWAKDVTPEKVHSEYPRPQMVRQNWQNLNGLWDYAIRPKDDKQPEKWDGKILVPFPVESTLSGVKKRVGDANRLWYRRTFKATITQNERLLLHFGAVDWHAIVWVNGKQVGEHRGGYDPFHFDITDSLLKAREEEIVVSVWDPSDKGTQPRGKQVEKPGGIFYTPVTGIWQTVWLERVSVSHFRSLKITPDIDNLLVRFEVICSHVRKPDAYVMLAVKATDTLDKVAKMQLDLNGKATTVIRFEKKELALWSPESPKLYEATVMFGDGEGGDHVKTYFAMRKVEVKKDTDGFNRLFLNNKPLFQYGPLDQGWWPDGLYTAPTDEALKYDLEVTKKLGFNMIRKHVKVEPARWYYHCDRLGILVWQDMPNGDRHINPNQPDIKRSQESDENYYREWKAIIDARRHHPCIVAWVPFNEGWGQFDTNKVLEWTKKQDPTRLVDGPSGWADRGGGDLHDVHIYPGPGMPKPEEKRAAVLGEFGGLGLPIEGHLWQKKDNWGYRTFKTREELQTGYEELIRRLRPLINKGLAAAVYTQTTDVETEVNGLLTYDRAVLKVDAEKVARLHRRLYEPPGIEERTDIVPTSEKDGQKWRYLTSKPAEGWMKPDFDDSTWKGGVGGFGTKGTPGAIVRTTWDGKDIWLRRTFEWKGNMTGEMRVRIHHDEDAEVYINGMRVASVKDFTTEYIEFEIDDALRKALKPGTNTIAVHCHQTTGGQYIDVGFVNVVEKPLPGK